MRFSSFVRFFLLSDTKQQFAFKTGFNYNAWGQFSYYKKNCHEILKTGFFQIRKACEEKKSAWKPDEYKSEFKQK
jgi:hypothetical protein